MSKDKGRMLARTGWQGWDCECCGEPSSKGSNRAREKREWKTMTAEENAERVRTTREKYIEDRGGIHEVLKNANFIDASDF